MLAVAFGALLFTAFQTFGSYSLTVTELQTRQSDLGMTPTEIAGRPAMASDVVKIHGWVAESNASSTDGAPRFTITDGKTTLPVFYKGGIAGALSAGTELIVEGTYSSGSLEATRVKTTKEVRVEGPLSPDTEVRYDVASRTTWFTMLDSAESGVRRSLPVVYTGAVPDTFFIDVKTVDVSMVAIGRLGPDGVFVASQILSRCASRYEATLAPAAG